MILLTFNIIYPKLTDAVAAKVSEGELRELTVHYTKSVLQILERQETLATFFIDSARIGQLGDLLKTITNGGHEIGIYHGTTQTDELEALKLGTEELIGKQIRGIRMKKDALPLEQLLELRFTYISLMEETALIFPFKRFERKAPFTEKNGLSILHESISPYSQIPYNDLIFQLLPGRYYQSMIIETIRQDEFILIYLNIWQFVELKKNPLRSGIFRQYNAGKQLEAKLERFLEWINENNLATSRVKDYMF